MKLKAKYAQGAIGRRRNKLFFQVACVLLSVTLLLCSCAQSTIDSDTIPTSPNAETSSETDSETIPETSSETTPEATTQDPLIMLQQWLKTNCSFTLSYQYMNLAINGMSQETIQTFAADGSWYFKNQRKVWDHTSNYESEENAEFFYRYENSQLTCYSSIDGDTPQRTVLTDSEKADMDESKSYMVGVPGLLPDYMQDFSVTQSDDTTVLTFRLPVEKVLADSTLLSMFVKNVFSLSGNEYKSEYNAMILCSFETDSQTFQPKSLSYDFSQLKPYVLSNGAQSGEYALDADFLTMTYSFDYNLPDTTEIPAHLIP